MARGSRPNILLIHWHDLGQHLGCYGHRTVQSPYADALAAEGVRFERSFCTAPLCSPSRGSLFSGRYPHANGLMGLVNLGWELPAAEVTMQDLLGKAGYRTHLIGFQHERKDPATLGFHEVFQPEGTPFGQKLVAAAADLFLKAAVEEGGPPFFASVGFFEVHRLGKGRGYKEYLESIYPPVNSEAFEVPPYLPDNHGTRSDLAGLHACIREADAALGAILSSLRAAGLEENTLVVFTTDHGIAFPRAKGTLYDAGIETALIMRWPSGFEGGRVLHELVSNVDLLPTLLEVADTSASTNLHGRSFLPLLTGGTYEPRREVFAEKTYHNAYDPVRAIRTDHYKYVRSFSDQPLVAIPGDVEQSLTRRAMGDSHLVPRPVEQLFDLQADPLEERNLIGVPANEALGHNLATRLEVWMQETGDPLLEGPIPLPYKAG